MAKVSSMPLGGFSGRLGNVVFVEQPFGTSMRERVIPRNPHTPAQTAWRNAIKAAGKAYHNLNATQHAAWMRYAQTIAMPGQRPAPIVQTFVRLGAKAYSVDPSAAVPLMPPTAPFGGDCISVTISAVSGAIRFTSDGANAKGTVTELLVQRIPSPFALTYARRYRTKAVATFMDAGEFVNVSVLPGCYACAIRFVEASTGQCTGILPIGVVTV